VVIKKRKMSMVKPGNEIYTAKYANVITGLASFAVHAAVIGYTLWADPMCPESGYESDCFFGARHQRVVAGLSIFLWVFSSIYLFDIFKLEKADTKWTETFNNFLAPVVFDCSIFLSGLSNVYLFCGSIVDKQDIKTLEIYTFCVLGVIVVGYFLLHKLYEGLNDDTKQKSFTRCRRLVRVVSLVVLYSVMFILVWLTKGNCGWITTLAPFFCYIGILLQKLYRSQTQKEIEIDNKRYESKYHGHFRGCNTQLLFFLSNVVLSVYVNADLNAQSIQ
jgi:hypothetical protein